MHVLQILDNLDMAETMVRRARKTVLGQVNQLQLLNHVLDVLFNVFIGIRSALQLFAIAKI